MCLATVYKNPENTVVCKNVSRIDVDGEYVLIRDIMGEEIRLQGKIKNGRSCKQHCRAGL